MGQLLIDDVDRPLQERFGGQVLDPDSAGYDQARRVFNGLFDRRPALIARCSGAADVIAAVNYARRKGLLLSVYGGGHSFAGHAVCEGGLVIDLRPMKGMRVDPARRVVHAQAGLTWAELDRETQAFGLAVTGGRDSTTGVAGLTLGSGSGWLDRLAGRTCDNLLSADVVTADGSFLTASRAEHAELFWGLRGGGGNFGVVTSFEFALHPVGPAVLGGMLLYPRAHAAQVLRFYRRFIAEAPDEVAGACSLTTAPDVPFVPEQVRGQPVLGIIACYLGPVEQGESALRPLRAFGPPALNLVAPIPYTTLQRLAQPAEANGSLYYATFDFLPELSDEAIDVLVSHTEQAGRTVAVIIPFGGAVARRPEDATAFGHRQEPFGLNLVAQWADPADTDRQIAATRALAQAMRPFTSGGGLFLNGTSDDGTNANVVRSAFGPQAYRRLVALKNRYDPDNLFRLNHNIPPTPRPRPRAK